ncbi:MAG: anti-virulence regulator CigR family protein [Caulobacterales bacterium]
MRIISATAVLLSVALAAPAEAKPKNKPHGEHQGDSSNAPDTGAAIVGAAFNAAAEREIRSYFREAPMAPEGLPPGIAKNLARGKPLPPGIAKRYLPGTLRSRLPGYDGYDVVIVGRDVLLVAAATLIIVDILTDVL